MIIYVYNINIDMGVSENCGLFMGDNGSHDQQRHIWMCLKLGGKHNFLFGKSMVKQQPFSDRLG